MDLPLHNRLAYNRVRRRSASPLAATPIARGLNNRPRWCAERLGQEAGRLAVAEDVAALTPQARKVCMTVHCHLPRLCRSPVDLGGWQIAEREMQEGGARGKQRREETILLPVLLLGIRGLREQEGREATHCSSCSPVSIMSQRSDGDWAPTRSGGARAVTGSAPLGAPSGTKTPHRYPLHLEGREVGDKEMSMQGRVNRVALSLQCRPPIFITQIFIPKPVCQGREFPGRHGRAALRAGRSGRGQPARYGCRTAACSSVQPTTIIWHCSHTEHFKGGGNEGGDLATDNHNPQPSSLSRSMARNPKRDALSDVHVLILHMTCIATAHDTYDLCVSQTHRRLEPLHAAPKPVLSDTCSVRDTCGRPRCHRRAAAGIRRRLRRRSLRFISVRHRRRSWRRRRRRNSGGGGGCDRRGWADRTGWCSGASRGGVGARGGGGAESTLPSPANASRRRPTTQPTTHPQPMISRKGHTVGAGDVFSWVTSGSVSSHCSLAMRPLIDHRPTPPQLAGGAGGGRGGAVGSARTVGGG